MMFMWPIFFWKQVLAEADTDIPDTTLYGHTSLHVSARKGNMEFVNLLLGANAAVNTRASDNATPLFLAVSNDVQYDYRHVQIVLRLLRARAETDVACGGDTPLTVAVKKSSYHVMWYLLQARASPNVLDRKFRPVLHIATYMDDMCAAQMLLDHRADVNKVDFENRTAFDLATRFLRLHLMRRFLMTNSMEKDTYPHRYPQ